MVEKTFVVTAEEGLHARPASLLAKACMKFKSTLSLYKGEDKTKIYQPKSILSIMTIGAGKGDTVTITADGEDEVYAMEQLTALFESNFEG
jgi:phosphotransferase system HPr (HPr) family protein